MNFDEIVKKVEETKELTLDELFDLWKEAQAVEEEWEKTTLIKDSWTKKEKLRRKFTADGIVDSKAYLNASCKVLVVLKEPNISDNKPDDAFDRSDDHRIWYNEFVDGKYNPALGKIEDGNDNPSCQKQLIGRMSYLLQEYWETQSVDGNVPTAKQIQDALKKTAIMNLNKRGGDKKVEKTIFKNYCKKYEVFIKREIELIDPDVIVWCVPEIADPQHDFRIASDKVIIPMIHTAGAIYIRNKNKDLPFQGTQLDEYCNNMCRMDRSKYMKCRKSIAKYMLVFETRVRKAFELGKRTV